MIFFIVNWHDSMPENFIVKMYTNAADLEKIATGNISQIQKDNFNIIIQNFLAR